jgi:hypothetical protein
VRVIVSAATVPDVSGDVEEEAASAVMAPEPIKARAPIRAVTVRWGRAPVVHRGDVEVAVGGIMPPVS